jgi:DNA-binding MarR family transcriptional regulator
MKKTIAQDGQRMMPKQGYIWFHDVLLDVLTIREFAVYCVLAKYADNETQQCYPHQTTIVRDSKCSESTVKRALRRMQQLELVARVRTVRGNSYQLLHVDEERLKSFLRLHRSPVTPRTGHTRPVAQVTSDPLKELDLVNQTQVNQTEECLTPPAPLAVNARSAEAASADLTEDERRERQVNAYNQYLERLNRPIKTYLN